jgi:chaperonin GroEL
MLEDLAVLTSAKLVSDRIDMKLENTHVSDPGRAEKATIHKDNTTIVGGSGDADALQRRVRSYSPGDGPKYDGEKLQERLAKVVRWNRSD